MEERLLSPQRRRVTRSESESLLSPEVSFHTSHDGHVARTLSYYEPTRSRQSQRCHAAGLAAVTLVP
eukprot:7288708-Pyramimonas_sp.AAC.1